MSLSGHTNALSIEFWMFGVVACPFCLWYCRFYGNIAIWCEWLFYQWTDDSHCIWFII